MFSDEVAIMKQLFSLALAAIAAVSISGPAYAQEPENDRWIVQFEGAQGENEIEALIGYAGGQTIKRLPLVNGRSARGSEAMAAVLRTSILVKRVEKDVIRKATAKTAQGQSLPWGVDRIDADLAWNKATGEGVKVAVLDTGISRSHPDLKDNIKGGYNAIDPTKVPEDQNGHGSHVAGIIAAFNNSFGVVGVAPKASLYAVQVLGASGWGYCSDIIEGLTWIINNHMQVANMSYGGSEPCSGEIDALDSAYNAGITLVAAAGNNSGGEVDWPAKHDKVIAVTAINSQGAFASFSSKGTEVDLTAPGVSIPSTYKKGGYQTLSGTSMAAPHVSGVAALVLQKNPNFAPAQIKARLESTAECLTNLGVCTTNGTQNELQGHGLLNAEVAAK